ncbi:transient receptor potential cation channel trpm isoform X6 [Neocloeon triangulifer]|uniref:transient receptor potential cation channel trpm isoform X6 n=1 Tax=Neocloeon triangulifer TaxID=2078957 RepID=UPI00286F8313|nr:transient receptor potential cation channel trpm isoform X6 [Neocloeon triangulifer]
MKMKSKRNAQQPKTTARSWVEANFQKRECIKFIPTKADEHRCCCGLSLTSHLTSNKAPEPSDKSKTTPPPKPGEELVWLPTRHTQAKPCDAYGTIEFQGGPHPSKAQYVRLAYDTRPDLILQLFTREWGLELPKLLLTIQGGKANFELQAKLKKVLRKGLLKAAKTTGAWIFTGGTNTGVTRQVGDALLMERSQRSGRVVSIGIAPWGIVENNSELVGKNRDVPYHSISSPRSKFAVLNNRHAYFLLVDNGTAGRYGAEIHLRRRLEKYISAQNLHPSRPSSPPDEGTHCSIPVVCLVIEGGTNTIRAVLEYVTDDPPVPVVVCDGSGRAADLLAFTHKYASETGEQTVLESMKDYLISMIQRTFDSGIEQAEQLYTELLQCTRKKNLITVFRITDRPDEKMQELDQTILTALFKSQHLSPSEQLSLALTWNRVDIARSEIFVYGQEWPSGALEEAMMQALEHDRIDFVKLLLENGVSMKKFLTIPRLEELYNTKQGPSNTLGYILRDCRPHIPRGYQYTLHDIGLVINKLMGGAYRTDYTRRKFRVIYAKVMKRSQHVHRNSASFMRYYGNANVTLSLLTDVMPFNEKDMPPIFDYPFNELLIWAVLTKRQQMALLMWQHGEEALAKSLVACKLYKAMAHEAAEDDLETEIYEELRNYGKEFENISLDLVDFCYRQDDDQTQQMLTCELQNWSGQTCLSLAVAANHRPLIAHPCSQIILADLWMGGLRTRKNTNMKVFFGLIFPAYISRLEFKTKEELQHMPQTEEEHNTTNKDESLTEKSADPELNRTDGHEVEENGKLKDEDSICSEHSPPPLEFFDIKTHRPLRLSKKLEEFYTAPITKFWAHSIAYTVFLVFYSYVILVEMQSVPSWTEMYIITYICTFGLEKVREIASSEPVGLRQKLAVWSWNLWNPMDAAVITIFLIGLMLRLQSETMMGGRAIYCVCVVYWYLKILTYVGVNKYLGPLVTMMGKMVINMIYFVVLLLVVLMSFGVARQGILYPHNESGWHLLKDVVFQPYFMLYGEVFADDIDPPCGGEGQMACVTAKWISPIIMSIYLLVANILLINLLIAVFNNIFNEVNANSHQVWMFQRFTVVMEYEQKPVLPPPFIFISHIYLLIEFCRRKYKGEEDSYDNGLKLFLDDEDMERLYDFEEECVEGYFREKETKLQLSTDERIKTTTERVENMYQKIEDINQKENSQNTSIQSMEFRLRNLESMGEKTASHLAVIHRFMATHTGSDLIIPDGDPKGSDEKFKRIIELHPEPVDTFSDKFLHPSRDYLVRRRPTRSMTEIRPDSYLSESGSVFFRNTEESRNVSEPLKEEDSASLHEDADKPTLSRSSSRRSPTRLSAAGRHESTSIASLTEATDMDGNILRHQHSDDRESLPIELTVPQMESRMPRGDSWRRSSGTEEESGTLTTSHPSLPRRQLSQTQSEPDTEIRPGPSSRPPRVERSISVAAKVTWAEPKIQVIPPTPRGAMLRAMHSEYTSITDELESVCGLLSPPRTPRLLSPPRPEAATGASARPRHHLEICNPEMAKQMEKETLRDAEENDYLLMEGLIQNRLRGAAAGMFSTVIDDEDEEVETLAPLPRRESSRGAFQSSGGFSSNFLTVSNEMPEYRCPRLRRSSAVDEPHLQVSYSEPAYGPMCPSIFCTDTDATRPHRRQPGSPRGSQNSLLNVVTETKI